MVLVPVGWRSARQPRRVRADRPQLPLQLSRSSSDHAWNTVRGVLRVPSRRTPLRYLRTAAYCSRPDIAARSDISLRHFGGF